MSGGAGADFSAFAENPLKGFQLSLGSAASGLRRMISALYSDIDFRRDPDKIYHWATPVSQNDCVVMAAEIFKEAGIEPVPDKYAMRMEPSAAKKAWDQAMRAVQSSGGDIAESAAHGAGQASGQAPGHTNAEEDADNAVMEDTYVIDGLQPLRCRPNPPWMVATLAASSVGGRWASVGAGFTSTFVDVRTQHGTSTTLHVYDSHGDTPPSGAPPIVLIHGMLTTGLCMLPLAVVLASCSGRRVLAPDLPDFEYGWSRSQRAARGGAPTNWDEKVAVMGQYVANLADAYGAPVDIVGHSYGGYVVEKLSIAYTTSVRKVVSLAPAGSHRYRNFFPAASLASTTFSQDRFDPRIPRSLVRNITLTVRAMAQSPSVMRFVLSQRLGRYLAAQPGGIPVETLLIFPHRDNLQMPYFGAQHPLGDAIMMRDVRQGKGLWCTGVSHGLVVEVPCLLADEINAFCGEYKHPSTASSMATPMSSTWLRIKLVAAAFRAASIVSERSAALLPMQPDAALLRQQREAADAVGPRLQQSFGIAYDPSEAGLVGRPHLSKL